MSKVTENTVVTIRYIMQNGRGEVLEDTRTGPSVSYLHGGSGILRSLQLQLDGLKEGERKQVFLLNEAGGPGDHFKFEVWIENIREALPQELLVGYPLSGAARECAPGCIC